MKGLSQLLVIRDTTGPWAVSANAAYQHLEDAMRECGFSNTVVRITESIQTVGSAAFHAIKGTKCVLCHVGQSNEQFVKEHINESAWVFVSGGQNVVTDSFRALCNSHHVIWFQGAYGREINFYHWAKQWAETEFDLRAFRGSESALYLGASGISLQLLELQRHLLPLRILLEGFDVFTLSLNSNGDGDCEVRRSKLVNELSKGVSEILSDIALLDQLSSTATLIDGWLQGCVNIDPSTVRNMREALNPLIPHNYGHGGEYHPRLDMDLIKLGANEMPPAVAVEAAHLWCRRLDLIFSGSFLEAVTNAKSPKVNVT